MAHENFLSLDFQKFDKGLILFCIDGMLNNGLIYSSIALSSNMLVARFGFDENSAGQSAMLPYMVFACSIPFVVGYVET